MKSNYEKSFNGLLKYYYKNNDFGYENKRIGELCNKCLANNLFNNLITYNMITTLPEILIVDLNLHNYYKESTDLFLRGDSLYWALEKDISLKDYCDNYSYNYFDYELTSFIGHSGGRYGGHFINFSKIDDKWYLFDDLRSVATKYEKFEDVKALIKENSFFGGKLHICILFYEKNNVRGYEDLIKNMRNIFYKK